MCECDPLRGILCGYHRAQKETDRRPPALPSDEEMADVRAWNDLTARAERAEAAEADLRATVERVRALHTVVVITSGHPHGLARGDRLVCRSCEPEHGGLGDAWPCPTIAALDSTTPPPSPEGEGARALADAADALERYADNYPESVFPPDSDSRDAIGGTAMRHAYRNAARMVRAAALDGGQPDTPAPTEEPRNA